MESDGLVDDSYGLCPLLPSDSYMMDCTPVCKIQINAGDCLGTGKCEDMYDHGGLNPPSPHGHPPTHPSPAKHQPADFPAWLSSTSPETPSSPKECLSTPLSSPPRSPLPVTRPLASIPCSQTPILPLLWRKQPRNPPPVDWRENQYNAKNAEQFRTSPRGSGAPSIQSLGLLLYLLLLLNHLLLFTAYANLTSITPGRKSKSQAIALDYIIKSYARLWSSLSPCTSMQN